MVGTVRLVACIVASASAACTKDEVARSMYEGLQARECITREGDSYPHVGEDCRRQDYDAYRDERERALSDPESNR